MRVNLDVAWMQLGKREFGLAMGLNNSEFLVSSGSRSTLGENFSGLTDMLFLALTRLCMHASSLPRIFPFNYWHPMFEPC